ncbi:MAG: PSD1 domain-containing protein [Pirellulales bacterium]|nr:PSD1 domain-containing protein [Pirellulales bacterium]
MNLANQSRIGRLPTITAVAAIAAMLGTAVRTAVAEDRPISFSHQVRPILAENCFHCHGPDPSTREADLRLDLWDASPDDALTAESVVTPGEPDASELVARITSRDPDLRMPPADSDKSLSLAETTTLVEWVRQGGRYEQHWAFTAPKRPALPQVKLTDWVRNPIDAFVLARLDAEGLRPSPPATPGTLLRRVSLDLTGLPPTLEEIDDFARRAEDDAYRALVDRLLASPRHAEHWARAWLDAARYADSDGYEKDHPRSVWMYRDWVVDALDRDMPYDEFVVRQIAGDLLPDATQADRVATGFLRNSMVNKEGGIDPEQFRMEAMFDRMDAIGKSILGLTLQCAQCHSHKYDPLSHTEYYRLFAFLNHFHEAEMAAYSPAELAQIEQIRRQTAVLEDELKRTAPAWESQVSAWADDLAARQPEWTVLRPELDGSGGQKQYLQEDGSILAQGYAPPQVTSTFEAVVELPSISAIRVELLNDPNLPLGGPGRGRRGLCYLSEIRVFAAPVDAPDQKTELKLAAAYADVNPPPATLPRTDEDGEKPDRLVGPVELSVDGDDLTAWSIDIGPGRSNVPRQAVFVLDKPLACAKPMRVTVTLAQLHGGRSLFSLMTDIFGRFRLSATAASYDGSAMAPARVAEALATPAASRTPAQLAELFTAWRTTRPEWQATNSAIDALWAAHPRGATQLVVEERTTPRRTCRLDRGDFLAPAEETPPGTPAFLHLFESERPDRLALARWLVDRNSPTAARAIVNRVWQAYFGTGLVATSDDFGLQGEPPSHPELLDWLAVEFMEHHWSLKHLHRLIVTSAAYRQESRGTPELLARDPQNRLLARGPRGRLPAEGVQDLALAASGLLNPQRGGPAVHPPAPQFLFEVPASYEPKIWAESPAPDRYRRALYVFRFRSVPFPVLENFDAPAGNVACVRRSSSNTPMQALTLLNETLLAECAQSLADHALAVQGDDLRRIDAAFRRCTSRSPGAEESAVLVEFLDRQRQRFATGDADPVAIVGSDSPGDVPPAERAAWFALARVLLNLDETISKN